MVTKRTILGIREKIDRAKATMDQLITMYPQLGRVLFPIIERELDPALSDLAYAESIAE
jgi:hypothetical protein